MNRSPVPAGGVSPAVDPGVPPGGTSPLPISMLSRLCSPRIIPNGLLNGLRALILLYGLTMRSGAAGPILIDEVLADNRSAVPVAGRFPDFVELRNTIGTPVDLGGCTLSDAGTAGTPLVFPVGTTLAGGGRLVVWCDRGPGLPAPQADFGIGSTGDRIRLTGPDGSPWDEITFGLQIADHSIGRVGDGSGQGGAWRLTQPTPGSANVERVLGDPTRLRVNEWMASPSVGDDWLEVFNGDVHPVELSGLLLTDRNALPFSNRPIPALSFIAGRGFVQFFASDLEQTDADHLDFKLSAGGDQILLVATDRVTILDRVAFGAQADDVSGGRTPDGGEGVLEFAPGRATPGASNGRELVRVVVSEVLSHTDPPFEDAIELHNPTGEAVDVGDWWLSDAASTPRKYRIPTGTILPAGGYLAFYEYQFSAGPNGFSLNSYEGDEVWISVGDASGNLTGERGSVRFGATRNGVAIGTVTTSIGTDFAPLLRPTFGVDAPVSVGHFRQGHGGVNAPAREPVAVLAEWFFAVTGDSPAGRGEPFVEIFNPGVTALPLYDVEHPTNAWRLRGDLRFDLPTGLVLEPSARLIVVGFHPTADPARLATFRTAFDIPDSTLVVGPWAGEASQDEPALELQGPDTPEGPDKPRPGFVPYVRVDRLDYRPTIGWPAIPGHEGRSLRRVDVREHGNEPTSWTWDRPSPGRELPPNPDADTDRDGMPDAWERIHGFDPSQASDGGEDVDEDGASNVDEYGAGTNPREAGDVLRVTAQREAAGGIRIGFNAVGGKTYELEGRPLGGSGSWRSVGSSAAPGESGPISREIPIVPEPWAYRVVVRAAP